MKSKPICNYNGEKVILACPTCGSLEMFVCNHNEPFSYHKLEKMIQSRTGIINNLKRLIEFAEDDIKYLQEYV
jgi:hypothetical protein